MSQPQQGIGIRGQPQAHIEPAGNAFAIIEAARVQGLTPHEIDAKYVGLSKDGRALPVEPHVTGGRLKNGRSALDKRTNYRGVVANHLVQQVTGFRAFDKDAYRREDDLFDAAMYGARIFGPRYRDALVAAQTGTGDHMNS
jgi:hypothetical protein